MHNFYTWFSIGVSHILNWEAYDHVLFLFALCCIYTFRQWKKVLVLITAFTVGHSLTLALSVMHLVVVNMAWVEFLIAITIVVTCIYNIRIRENIEITEKSIVVRASAYIMACVFGLIHGLGFASVLQDMLSGSNMLLPLFSFNIGIEVGQVIVVISLLLITNLLITAFKVKQSVFIGAVSTVIAGFALIVAVGRFTDIFRH